MKLLDDIRDSPGAEVIARRLSWQCPVIDFALPLQWLVNCPTLEEHRHGFLNTLSNTQAARVTPASSMTYEQCLDLLNEHVIPAVQKTITAEAV